MTEAHNQTQETIYKRDEHARHKRLYIRRRDEHAKRPHVHLFVNTQHLLLFSQLTTILVSTISFTATKEGLLTASIPTPQLRPFHNAA